MRYKPVIEWLKKNTWFILGLPWTLIGFLFIGFIHCDSYFFIKENRRARCKMNNHLGVLFMDIWWLLVIVGFLALAAYGACL